MPSLLEAPGFTDEPPRKTGSGSGSADGSERGRSPVMDPHNLDGRTSHSPARVPTSAEIDAVIAAAMANAPPPPPPQQEYTESINRSNTPLMTNLLPAAVGVDGRVNLFVGNLPYRVRWQDLKDLFRKAGTVLRADVSLGPDNRSRGYGTVLMGSREDAARAIDRYNGYTWQTRTLEVRPDRLPPEYEPQNQGPPHQHPHQQLHQQHQHAHHYPHQQQHPSRSGMYNFQGGQPFPHSGHLTPQGLPWPPSHGQGQGQAQGRPPFPGGLGSGSGSGSLGMLVAPPLGLSGSSPGPNSHSPAAMYGSVSLPLSVQNTGGPTYPQLAASPLAGSLSAGSAPPSSTNISGVRRDSHTPYSHTVSPDHSPAPDADLSSRATSSNSQLPPTISSPNKGGTNRAPPPGTLGRLPQPPLADAKAVISPSSSTSVEGNAEAHRPSPALDDKGAAGSVSGPSLRQLEGLSHQGMGLGPPSTLHDRVIFVSNLPLSMQWQDLKDMLRPAGTIIRADVATEASGRPRGFGTALFASEVDAAKAVNMFNDRDIGGHRIRAHLERESRNDGQRVDPAHGEASALGFGRSPPPRGGESGQQIGRSNGIPPPIDTQTSPEAAARRPSGNGTGETSPAAKLPWSLNTSLQQSTPGRPSSVPNATNTTPGPHQHTPNFRQLHHPGPISMPPFPPLDHNNPISPLQTRGMPPMTPSMPGFVFNAYPETPPVHPHFMSMSPGIGPFSPGIPVTSPNAFGYNPFLNAAPGAPVNRYPGPGANNGHGSAALGTPTTQAFPNGPAPGTIHQYAGPPGGQPLNISQALSGSYTQEYFPPTSSNSAPDTPTPKVGNKSLPGISPLNALDRLAASSSIEQVLVNQTDALSLDGAARRPSSVPAPRGGGEGNGHTDGTAQRRASEMKGLGLASASVSGSSNGFLNSGMNGGGRQSLDETRPVVQSNRLGGPTSTSAERRASFGDRER